LTAQGYEGGYSRLTDYNREWRAAAQGGVGAGDAYVPLSFELGEAFQFDWSEESLVIGGVYQKLQVAHMKLCGRRAFWLVAYPGQGHEVLFDAHTRSFAVLGGVARRGIYDNIKTVVDRVGRGKTREVNVRFTAMCAHKETFALQSSHRSGRFTSGAGVGGIGAFESREEVGRRPNTVDDAMDRATGLIRDAACWSRSSTAGTRRRG
jgi:transposase